MRWIWGFLVLLLAGCGAARQPATVAVQPMPSSAATETLQPTETATPTPRLTSTSTAASTVIPPFNSSLPPNAAIARANRSSTVVPQTQATVPTATPTATPTPSPTALPTALPTPRPTSAAPPDQSIRSTDWEALIGVQNMPLPHYLLDSIAYADLNGDGVEEAILPYYSGGTAGILYFSIFCQTASGPVEVGRVDGYKAGIDLQDGYLIRTTTLYAGWEPNCCPGGLLLTGYTLRGAVLEPVAEWRMGDTSMAGWMLSRYFSSWRLQRYLDSYRLLDDAIRARVPYSEWRRQQDRQRIKPDEDVDITFTPLLTTTDILQPLGTVLTATIAMTGHYTLPGGRLETRHYTGTWPIAYRPFAIEHSNGYVNESYGWVILTDTLHLVPEPPPPATLQPTQTATRTPRPTRTPIPTPTMSASPSPQA